MNGPRRVKLFRAASVVIAPAMAWAVAFSRSHEVLRRTWVGAVDVDAPRVAPSEHQLAELVTYVLGPLWLSIGLALLLRVTMGRQRDEGLTLLDRLDVLTASGSGTLWLSSLAIIAAVRIGWASLAVLGVAGMGVVALVVVWTLLLAGGDDPMRIASIQRTIGEEATEGDTVVESLHLVGTRIPTGFRLFATGRVGSRWPVSRYAVDASASGGDVVVESDLGPAWRGLHEAPPLDLWLGDVLGLCHSVRRQAAPATLRVVPRLRRVDGARKVLGRGGHDGATVSSQRLPTEGVMRLKEYQPGDDARRIHWMRSLAAREVVVRLPDEVPRDRPKARLLLDTFLPNADALTCDAHHQLLDGLVKVWLGAARSLAEEGTSVTLLVAAPRSDGGADALKVFGPRKLALSTRSLAPALRLGAEVRWQDDLAVEDLLNDTKETTIVVSFRPDPRHDASSAPKPPGTASAAWIHVPRSLWTHFEEPVFVSALATVPFPVGSADNRWSRRRQERKRARAAEKSSETLLDLASRQAPSKGVIARPVARDRIVLEALS